MYFFVLLVLRVLIFLDGSDLLVLFVPVPVFLVMCAIINMDVIVHILICVLALCSN